MSKQHSSKRHLYDFRARALSLLFALVLAIPAAGMFYTDDNERMRWENRPLVAFPSLLNPSKEESYFSELDEYLNDHFGFALEMNRLHRRLLFFVFQDSPSPTITLGRDGFVFLNSHDHQVEFGAFETLCINGAKQEQFEPTKASWSRAFSFFENKIDRVALLIPLSKPTLYADKLPMSIPRKYREACSQFRLKKSTLNELATWGEATGNLVIYPANDFHIRRFEDNFFPKEHFHFSGMSAHLFARITLEHLGIHPTEAFDLHYRVDATTNDLSTLIGFNRSIQVDYFPYTEFKINKRLNEPQFVTDYYKRASDFGTTTSEAPLTERTALIISNSFGAFAIDHLAPAYRSVTWVNINALADDETARFFSEFVERIDPDDLLFLFHDDSAVRRSSLWVSAFDSLEKQKQ